MKQVHTYWEVAQKFPMFPIEAVVLNALLTTFLRMHRLRKGAMARSCPSSSARQSCRSGQRSCEPSCETLSLTTSGQNPETGSTLHKDNQIFWYSFVESVQDREDSKVLTMEGPLENRIANPLIRAKA